MKKKTEKRMNHFFAIIIALFVVIATYFNIDVEQYLIESGIIETRNTSQILSLICLNYLNIRVSRMY